MNIFQPVQGAVENMTQDGFATEAEAEEWAFAFLSKTECFRVYRQMVGEPLYKHHLQNYQSTRCDIMLFPSDRIIACGWGMGAAVVEIKKSGVAIGPSINQAMDYLRCVFPVPKLGAVGIMPSVAFVFPVLKQHRATASIMSHQHVGSCSITRGGGMAFFFGEERVLEFAADGSPQFVKNTACGKKFGSR